MSRLQWSLFGCPLAVACCIATVVFLLLGRESDGQQIRFDIIPADSTARVVEGVPSLLVGDPVLVGSRAVNTFAIIPQAEGSLQATPSGYLEGSVTDSNFVLTSGRIQFSPIAAGPFNPPVGAGESPSTQDVVAGMDHATNGAALSIAIRDLELELSGNAELGGPVGDTNVAFTAGTMDFASLLFDSSFLSLTDFDPVPNMASDDFVGEVSSRIEFPISVDQFFSAITEDDSRIVIEARLVAARSVVGDFDGSGNLDIADIDLLSETLLDGSLKSDFDLDMDGTLSRADIGEWLGLFGTQHGDADLNKAVDFADFLILSSNFGASGFWSSGDFDADGQVGFTDFLALSQNFGQPSTTIAVPEAGTSLFWALVGFLALGMDFAQRQRCRSTRSSHVCSP